MTSNRSRASFEDSASSRTPRGASAGHAALARTLRLSVLATALAGAAPLAAQENPFAGQSLTTLKQAGISPTKEELSALLKQHHLAVGDRSSTAELVKQLGDDDFFVREAALQQLLQAAARDTATLENAVKSSDPEIRWRAKVVLERANTKPKSDLLYAAFVVIYNQKISGLTDEILGCGPACASDHLRQALLRSLEASAVADDAPKLRKAIGSQDVVTRSSAAVVLSKLVGEAAKPDLMKLLNDPEEPVLLLAAEQLAKLGSQEALTVLGKLLDSEATQTRTRSSQILRATLKTDLPYSAFAPAETRKKQAEALREFIKTQGQKPPTLQ